LCNIPLAICLDRPRKTKYTNQSRFRADI